MSKYCLGTDECANLSAEYDNIAFNFAYGLRLLQICVQNADDVYSDRPGYEDFIVWSGELLGLVNEGFEYIERAVNPEESSDEVSREVDWDSDGQSRKLSVPDLINLMHDLAGSLESALDDAPDVSVVLDLGDKEYERLENDVWTVSEKVREVGYQAYSFLIGSRFQVTDRTGSDTDKLEQQNVDGMFSHLQ